MVHIKYKNWFTLQLDIEGYAGDAWDLCSLEPTERCRQQLDAHRILVRRQPDRLIHLIEVHPDGPFADQPLREPDPAAVFKYLLYSRAGQLEARTNIAATDTTRYSLYFSNDAGNKSGDTLYLNRKGTAAGTDDRLFRGLFDETASGCAGVVNIFQHELVSPDYRLQDGAGACREPIFTIRFAKHP